MLTVDFSEFPVLRTSRLSLREMTSADAPALFRMRSDARVMEHIGRPHATTLQDAMDLIDRITADRAANAGMTWAMQLHDTPLLIGTIGFYRLKLDHHTAEIGYMLDADHWGKALMSEALEAAVRCGFDRYRFHRTEAITDPRNSASRKVLEKCGFTLEGIQKENYLWNGEFQDSTIYGRLRDGAL